MVEHIITFFEELMNILLQAYKRGLWYPKYHFILVGWYSVGWWKKTPSDCTVEEIEQVRQSTLERAPPTKLLR